MELELHEGRIYGARYWTVRPFLNDAVKWDEIDDWCVQAFGPSPKDGIWTPGARWYANNLKYWFRNESDLTAFVLRWQT